jgi:hypothetical protein
VWNPRALGSFGNFVFRSCQRWVRLAKSLCHRQGLSLRRAKAQEARNILLPASGSQARVSGELGKWL